MMRSAVRVAPAVLALFVWLTVGLAPAAGQSRTAVGQVVDKRGAAVAVAGATTRILVIGVPVYAQERIATRPDAKLEIEFRDGSRLTLGPDTEVVLTEYAPGAGPAGGRGILTLLIGIIRTSLDDAWSRDRFEIRTRAAVASVRSTEWVTEATGDETAVFVVSGSVAVAATGNGDSVILTPGFGTDVDAGGPSAPARWGAPRVRNVLQRTRLP